MRLRTNHSLRHTVETSHQATPIEAQKQDFVNQPGLAVRGSPEEWRELGDKLMDCGVFAVAAKCYFMSGNKTLEQRAQAINLANEVFFLIYLFIYLFIYFFIYFFIFFSFFSLCYQQSFLSFPYKYCT